MSEKFRLSDFEPIIREVVGSGGEFVMKTHGTSMLPLLSDGNDSVVLASKAHFEVGDVVFYKRPNGQYVLHRIVGKRADGFVMRGDNQIINEYGITSEHIIAVMRAFIRNAKRTDVNDEDYKKYVSSLKFKYRKKKIKAYITRIKKKLVSPFDKKGDKQ